MRRITIPVLATIIFLLCAVRVQAQIVGPPVSVTLHGAPQGVTSCTIPAQVTPHTIGTGICPLISFQTHWKPGNGSPTVDPANTLLHDLAHTHIECNLPEEGEVGGPITVPCRFQAFHLDGSIALLYDTGQVTAFTVDDPTQWPVIGDPHGVVVVPFHLTIDPRQQARRDDSTAFIIQDHGWANIVFGVRTFVNNGDTYDTQPQWTIWSMVNPASPSRSEGEGTRIQLATKSTAVSARDTSSGPWGAHLIEFRNAAPMWKAISGPVAADAFAYTYGASTGFSTLYQLVCANDYHVGNPGVEMTFVTAQLPVSGEPFNHDFIDPLQISKAPSVPGMPPNTSRCTFIWQEGTPDDHAIDGSPGGHSGMIAAGEQLFSLLSMDVAWTPNPEGCNVTCSNAVGASPVTPNQPPPIVTVQTPNLVGQTQAQAASALVVARLVLGAVATANSPTVADGLVISQNPAADMTQPLGASVSLLVSSGPAPPPVVMCTAPAVLTNGQCVTPPPPPVVVETFTTRCTVQFQTGTQGHTQTLSDCPAK